MTSRAGVCESSSLASRVWDAVCEGKRWQGLGEQTGSQEQARRQEYIDKAAESQSQHLVLGTLVE